MIMADEAVKTIVNKSLSYPFSFMELINLTYFSLVYTPSTGYLT